MDEMPFGLTGRVGSSAEPRARVERSWE